MSTLPPMTSATGGNILHPRLGFVVMAGEDGIIPQELLFDLKDAGYDGIEPNCYQPQHLHRIAEQCQDAGLAIHALPTGRWLNVAAATDDYGRYTEQAFEVLSEGAAIAARLGASLIFGLIRGSGAIADAQSEEFLSSVIPRLIQTTPQLKVLVEPIAAGEAAWPHTIEQGSRLLERMNLPRVKLLADSYHIARSGEDPDLGPHRRWIGHLHIRDDQKQIPTSGTPEYAAVYAAIVRLWRQENLVLSFEPAIDLSRTLEQALVGVNWIRQAGDRA